MAETCPARAQDKQYPPDAVVNVTLPPYGAHPDGKTDCTEALQKAITDNVGTGRVLYFPPGIYLIRDTLSARGKDGLWKAELTLQGASPKSSIIRLANKSTGFNDINKPKPILATGSIEEKGDSKDGGGNKAFRNNILDLSIDTGCDNPGAIGIDYAISNQGSIKNVAIYTGDNHGAVGISLRRRIPGPGLIKNVQISGFAVGIDVGDMQYGITLEDVALSDQLSAGIRVSENLLHIRHLSSSNRAPVIVATDPHSMVTLVDSDLTGKVPNQPIIDCQGNLLLRNVTSNIFRVPAVRSRGTDVDGPDYPEFANPAALGPSPTENSLDLVPAEETPDYWNEDLSDWAPVGPRQAGESDDTASIQRAIDSGKSTIYFPNNRTYFLSDTVVVRGAVRQILGMGSEISLGAAKSPFSDRSHPRPLFRIDPTRGPDLFFEDLFFNAQYPGEILFENNSPVTVAIKRCMGWVGADGFRRSYRNTPNATGKLFLEDVFLPGWEFTKQSVWARQFNPENPDGDGVTPQVLNNGGKLWILGFKTEGPAPFLTTTSGGTTEMFGAYNYISATSATKVPANAVPYIITDAKADLTFLTDNFRDNDYRVYIRETAGANVRDWKGSDLAHRDGTPKDRSFVVPLYRSGIGGKDK